MRGDRFVFDLGGLRVRVISDTDAARSRLEGALDLESTEGYDRAGLLIAQPRSDSGVGTPFWVLYESGGFVLRRSRHEDEVIDAAAYQLNAIREAVGSDLLPLNVRILMQPDGSAWLVDPLPIYELAGFDRRLASRGVTVLPSSVALVDPGSSTLHLTKAMGLDVPEGQVAVSRVLLRGPGHLQQPAAAAIIALAKVVLRHSALDINDVLEHVVEFGATGAVEVAEFDDIEREVMALATAPAGP